MFLHVLSYVNDLWVSFLSIYLDFSRPFIDKTAGEWQEVERGGGGDM